MIPEREREALMRLTMCARGECPMCKYEEQCDNWDFRMELATKNMNILADALRAEQTEPNSSEKPNNCEWCKFFDGENCYSQEPCKVMLYFKTEPQTETSTNSEKVQLTDEPQTEQGKCPFDDPIPCEWVCTEWNRCKYKPKDEPQKWETTPKFEHKGFTTTCVSVPAFAVEDEPQTCDHRCVQTEIGCEKTDCQWR